MQDHVFYHKAVQEYITANRPKRGEGFAIRHSSVCQLCTRPLYGPEHEEWHARRHAEQLGLTYP